MNRNSSKHIKCLVDSCPFTGLNWKSLIGHARNQHNLKAQEYYNEFLKKEGEGLCLSCGKPTRFYSANKGYQIFCSPKCSNSHESSKSKKIKAFTERYGKGITNASHLSEVCKKISIANSNPEKIQKAMEKRKNTNREKYGFDFFLTDSKTLERIKETNEIRYGGTPFKNYEIRKKIKETNYKKYFDKIYKRLDILNLELVSPSYIDSYSNLKFRCKRCNTFFETKLQYIQQGYGTCPSCSIHSRSQGQQTLCKYIASLDNLEITSNSRSIISPLELDIYIPAKKIAIEYNGLYWHSEDRLKNKYYHLDKLKHCCEKNISLIQVFEDEWLFHQDIVKHRLKQILGMNNSTPIYARKCFIRSISSKEKNEFLNKYHLQGSDNSPLSLGAFYTVPHSKEQLLVAVMTFSHGSLAKGVKNKEEDVWELNRYCNNYNFHIPGIAGKLLSYFKKKYEWKKVYSYADRRWSRGNLYYKLGFFLEKETSPNYWYIKGVKRINRFALRKKATEPKDVPEWLLRMQEGYKRIWDCGHLKFVIKNSSRNQKNLVNTL